MPSYNVPPTQNTALVLEFRCLYTHDILKKQKKWHDGSLKFHTFNRRVMVYDDVKNYIGDLHYREQEEFGEGLELQLDRPVKVEVGEPIGQTSTDLRPIFDRGRAEREVRHEATAPERSIQRANYVRSSGKPKSLSEVLGPPQGRLGRARISTQSPFQQREALLATEPENPPSKKPKLLLGKENKDRTLPGKCANDRKQLKPSLSRPSPTVMRDVPVSRAHYSTSGIVDISSDEEVAKVADTRTRIVHIPDQAPTKPSTKEVAKGSKWAVRTAEQAQQRLKVAKSQQKTTSQDTQKSTSAVTPPIHVLLPSAAGGNCSRSTNVSETGMASLRLQVLPPRRKLMYKALLATGNSDARLRATEQRDGTDHIMHTSSGHQVSSPLFFSQDASQKSVSSNHIFEDDDFVLTPGLGADREDNMDIDRDLRGLSNTPVDATSSQTDLLSHMTSLKENSNAGNAVAEDAASVERNHALQSVTMQVHREADLEEIQRAAMEHGPQPAISPPHDLFHNPISEANLTSSAANPTFSSHTELREKTRQRDKVGEHHEPDPLLATSAIEASAYTGNSVDNVVQSIQEIHSESELHLPQPAIKPLEICQPINPATTLSPQPAEDPSETGAWSSLEAFLLFDKWPEVKVKSKPVFKKGGRKTQHPDTDSNHDDAFDGIEDQITLSMDTSTRPNRGQLGMRSIKRTMMPGIQSARSMLRGQT